MIRGSGKTASTLLPRVHRMASLLLERWLLGTHHGGILGSNRTITSTNSLFDSTSDAIPNQLSAIGSSILDAVGGWRG